MKKLLRTGMSLGFQRGLVAGSRGWIILGGVSLIGHLATRALKREYEVLWSGEVKPGQVLTVRHEPPT